MKQILAALTAATLLAGLALTAAARPLNRPVYPDMPPPEASDDGDVN
ncbi:MAG: hypothetical protein LBT60_07695 [Oscillospiraceae bacterium]|jgi:hypothetical protein|nr:hypothetical protein [Oscillospiraceae bacterium]